METKSQRLQKAKAYINWFEKNRYKKEKTQPPYSMSIEQARKDFANLSGGDFYLI